MRLMSSTRFTSFALISSARFLLDCAIRVSTRSTRLTRLTSKTLIELI
jgi:hypothetical protein